MAVHSRWDEAVEDARRYLLPRRRRADLLPELRARQRGIAEKLQALRDEVTA